MRFLALLFISSFAVAETNEKELMGARPQLYNGTRSVAGEFLPIGFIGNCTGTAVGDTVLFTASHCVTSGKQITFKPRFDGKSYSMTCYRHPRYNTRTVYNDYAFCVLNSGEFPKDMPKASFSFRSPDIGEKLLLNGYGAPTVGTHHWGPENVDRIDGQDIDMCGKVYLGGGDSGGSLLEWTEDRSGKSGFKILGVNSRGGGNCSYFNRTSHEEFVSWVKAFESQKGVEICGSKATCNGSTPPPPPPPPANCWKVYEEFAFCIGTKAIPQCLVRADFLKECVK